MNNQILSQQSKISSSQRRKVAKYVGWIFEVLNATTDPSHGSTWTWANISIPSLLYFPSFPFLLHKISFQFVRSSWSSWSHQSWWSNRGSPVRLSGHQDECGENPAPDLSVSVLHLPGGEWEEVPGNRHHPPPEENYQERLHGHLI